MNDGSQARVVERSAAPAATPRRPAPVLIAPPQDRAALLAELGPAHRALYAQVRTTVDELDRAVSWGLLYYPPDDTTILAERLAALASCIRRLPARLEEILPAFAAAESSESGDPLQEEVEFYFSTVQHMIEKDLARLESALRRLEPDAAVTPTELERLCELAADLKGKFASSIMGATAALLAQGRWPSLAAEVALFPEKDEESERTRELATALTDLVACLSELPDRVPLPEIVARWREGQRADQYAFADLVVLRGQLGSLLRERGRRALYSGDYHQIRQREVQLAERVSELEWLHRRTWAVSARAAAELIDAELPRLEGLVAEIAALTDVEQLKRLVGEGTVNRLRAATGKSAAAEPLVPLLAHDDLRLFFEMLLGAVRRRAALTTGEPFTAPPTPEPPPVTTAPPRPLPVPPRPAVPALSPEQQAALVADLNRRLTELQSPLNTRFKDFRMVLRMFGRHGRLPDEMVRAARPFVEDLMTVLVPDLRRLAPYRALSVDLVERLEGTCRGLLAAPDAAAAAAQPRLERLQRFLDALSAALGSG